jgi:hypothetical protein
MALIGTYCVAGGVGVKDCMSTISVTPALVLFVEKTRWSDFKYRYAVNSEYKLRQLLSRVTLAGLEKESPYHRSPQKDAD